LRTHNQQQRGSGEAGEETCLRGRISLGLGATLTTPYLQFEKEAQAGLGLPSGVDSPFCRSATQWAGSVRFAVFRSADVVYEDRWGQPYGD
jgi:hypothetical protein